MWWQYLIMAIVSISAALLAVHVDHWLSGRNEYRKAISSVEEEIEVNILICGSVCEMIDDDLNFLKESKTLYTPYFDFHELAWNAWKSVILFRNSKIAVGIEAAYLCIPIANNLLHRIEELKWGSVAVIANIEAHKKENLEGTKRCISETLSPRLRDAKEFLEKES